jgi:hypothetical protein
MNKLDFLNLMKFPKNWYEMYPDELYNIQLGHYRPGGECSSEHFRFGAFTWWLWRNPNKIEIMKLKLLAEQDEDIGVREDILARINDAELAKIAVDILYKLIDDLMYPQIYKGASDWIKNQYSEPQFIKNISIMHNKLGKRKEIKFIDCQVRNSDVRKNADVTLIYRVKYECDQSFEIISFLKNNNKFYLMEYKILSNNLECLVRL